MLFSAIVAGLDCNNRARNDLIPRRIIYLCYASKVSASWYRGNRYTSRFVHRSRSRGSAAGKLPRADAGCNAFALGSISQMETVLNCHKNCHKSRFTSVNEKSRTRKSGSLHCLKNRGDKI